MGATAAQCVFGKVTPVNRIRGRLIDLDAGPTGAGDGAPVLSAAAAGSDAKAREYQYFVSDLRIAAAFLHKSAHVA